MRAPPLTMPCKPYTAFVHHSLCSLLRCLLPASGRFWRIPLLPTDTFSAAVSGRSCPHLCLPLLPGYAPPAWTCSCHPSLHPCPAYSYSMGLDHYILTFLPSGPPTSAARATTWVSFSKHCHAIAAMPSFPQPSQPSSPTTSTGRTSFCPSLPYTTSLDTAGTKTQALDICPAASHHMPLCAHMDSSASYGRCLLHHLWEDTTCHVHGHFTHMPLLLPSMHVPHPWEGREGKDRGPTLHSGRTILPWEERLRHALPSPAACHANILLWDYHCSPVLPHADTMGQNIPPFFLSCACTRRGTLPPYDLRHGLALQPSCLQ